MMGTLDRVRHGSFPSENEADLLTWLKRLIGAAV